MPIYEYICSACGNAFEHLARTLADTPDQCPACGARKLRKQFSTFAKPVSSTTAACHGCAGEAACPSVGTGSGCGCSGPCGHHHA
jgi:putative FmdB family regulatory protein